ncbi:MAG: hypothetical protein QXZ70_01730 [Candidatus Bathyarchaeia archaeon]
MSVPWGQYAEAYKALHDKLVDILAQLSTVKDPSKYLPVRLTDGSAFYIASGGAGSGGLSQLQIRNSDNVWTDIGFYTGNLSMPVEVQNAVDIIDKADRILGRIHGSQGQQLKQRATTYELLVQLAHEGTEIDPRQIRPLTDSDTVTVVQATAANLKATVTQAEKDRTITDIQPHIGNSNQYTGTYAPTSAGSTTIISAVSGQTIKIYDICLWNSGTADVGVRLYYGTSGKNIFKGKLAPKTGIVKTFLRTWESNSNDSLVLYLDAAGTVDYGIGAVQS